MQNISAILIAGPSGTQWGDAYGTPALAPAVTVGVNAVLAIDLRCPRPADGGECAPYPADELTGDVASYFIAMDGDYDHATVPKLLRQNGISVSSGADGRTLLSACLPSTAHSALISAVNSRSSLSMHCETGGLDADGRKVFSFVFDVELRNTVWDPSDASAPAPDPADPDYLTAAQVRAYISAAIAEAAAGGALKGEKGDRGEPGKAGEPPVIRIGEVTAGELAADVTAGEDGSYTLSLTIPDPENPSLKVGEVTAGDTAAASLSLDSSGAYLLNLTLPRGASGAGVTLTGAAWDRNTAYARGDALRHNGAFWYSKADGNTGHEPPASRTPDSWWEVIAADGADSGLLMAFCPVADHDSPLWHSMPYRAEDRYYRISGNGGQSWGMAMPMAAPAVPAVYLFNPDRDTDWTDVTPGPAYSTAHGAYCRALNTAGAWSSTVFLGRDGETPVPQDLRLVFATAEGAGEPAAGDYHPVFRETDNVMKVFNASGTVLKTVTFNTNGVNIVKIQFCDLPDAWHEECRDSDSWYRFSADGGLTFSNPVPFRAVLAEDAPADGAAYARRNGQWSKLSPGQDDAPADGRFYARRNGAWVAIGNASGSPSGGGQAETGALLELPEHTERRCWEHLHLPYPADAPAGLVPQWQCSADGTHWSGLYSADSDPATACQRNADGSFTAWEGGDAWLPVWVMPMESVHVRCAWARPEGGGEYTRSDWAYRNTLGVALSPEGAERPPCNIPEYLYCTIPESTDHAELHFADVQGSYLGQPIYRSDDPAHGRAAYFNGEDVIAYDAATAPSFPLSPADGPFDGLVFIFNRRGLSTKCGLVWTGNRPVRMGWEL